MSLEHLINALKNETLLYSGTPVGLQRLKSCAEKLRLQLENNPKNAAPKTFYYAFDISLQQWNAVFALGNKVQQLEISQDQVNREGLTDPVAYLANQIRLFCDKDQNRFFSQLDTATRQQILKLLESIDSVETVEDELVSYIQALDRYQRTLNDYLQDEESICTLKASIIHLHAKAEKLEELLMDKSKKRATLSAFIGATIAIAAIPLTFLLGLIVSFAVIIGTSLAKISNSNSNPDPLTPESKVENKVDNNFLISVCAFATLPYYSVVKGAKIGYQLGEHGLFKGAKALNSFCRETLNNADIRMQDANEQQSVCESKMGCFV